MSTADHHDEPDWYLDAAYEDQHGYPDEDAAQDRADDCVGWEPEHEECRNCYRELADDEELVMGMCPDCTRAVDEAEEHEEQVLRDQAEAEVRLAETYDY